MCASQHSKSSALYPFPGSGGTAQQEYCRRKHESSFLLPSVSHSTLLRTSSPERVAHIKQESSGSHIPVEGKLSIWASSEEAIEPSINVAENRCYSFGIQRIRSMVQERPQTRPFASFYPLKSHEQDRSIPRSRRSRRGMEKPGNSSRNSYMNSPHHLRRSERSAPLSGADENEVYASPSGRNTVGQPSNVHPVGIFSFGNSSLDQPTNVLLHLLEHPARLESFDWYARRQDGSFHLPPSRTFQNRALPVDLRQPLPGTIFRDGKERDVRIIINSIRAAYRKRSIRKLYMVLSSIVERMKEDDTRDFSLLFLACRGADVLIEILCTFPSASSLDCDGFRDLDSVANLQLTDAGAISETPHSIFIRYVLGLIAIFFYHLCVAHKHFAWYFYDRYPCVIFRLLDLLPTAAGKDSAILLRRILSCTGPIIDIAKDAPFTTIIEEVPEAMLPRICHVLVPLLSTISLKHVEETENGGIALPREGQPWNDGSVHPPSITRVAQASTLCKSVTAFTRMERVLQNNATFLLSRPTLLRRLMHLFPSPDPSVVRASPHGSDTPPPPTPVVLTPDQSPRSSTHLLPPDEHDQDVTAVVPVCANSSSVGVSHSHSSTAAQRVFLTSPAPRGAPRSEPETTHSFPYVQDSYDRGDAVSSMAWVTELDSSDEEEYREPWSMSEEEEVVVVSESEKDKAYDVGTQEEFRKCFMDTGWLFGEYDIHQRWEEKDQCLYRYRDDNQKVLFGNTFTLPTETISSALRARDMVYDIDGSLWSALGDTLLVISFLLLHSSGHTAYAALREYGFLDKMADLSDTVLNAVSSTNIAKDFWKNFFINESSFSSSFLEISLGESLVSLFSPHYIRASREFANYFVRTRPRRTEREEPEHLKLPPHVVHPSWVPAPSYIASNLKRCHERVSASLSSLLEEKNHWCLPSRCSQCKREECYFPYYSVMSAEKGSLDASPSTCPSGNTAEATDAGFREEDTSTTSLPRCPVDMTTDRQRYVLGAFYRRRWNFPCYASLTAGHTPLPSIASRNHFFPSYGCDTRLLLMDDQIFYGREPHFLFTSDASEEDAFLCSSLDSMMGKRALAYPKDKKLCFLHCLASYWKAEWAVKSRKKLGCRGSRDCEAAHHATPHLPSAEEEEGEKHLGSVKGSVFLTDSWLCRRPFLNRREAEEKKSAKCCTDFKSSSILCSKEEKGVREDEKHQKPQGKKKEILWYHSIVDTMKTLLCSREETSVVEFYALEAILQCIRANSVRISLLQEKEEEEEVIHFISDFSSHIYAIHTDYHPIREQRKREEYQQRSTSKDIHPRCCPSGDQSQSKMCYSCSSFFSPPYQNWDNATTMKVDSLLSSASFTDITEKGERDRRKEVPYCLSHSNKSDHRMFSFSLPSSSIYFPSIHPVVCIRTAAAYSMKACSCLSSPTTCSFTPECRSASSSFMNYRYTSEGNVQDMLGKELLPVLLWERVYEATGIRGLSSSIFPLWSYKKAYSVMGGLLLYHYRNLELLNRFLHWDPATGKKESQKEFPANPSASQEVERKQEGQEGVEASLPLPSHLLHSGIHQRDRHDARGGTLSFDPSFPQEEHDAQPVNASTSDRKGRLSHSSTIVCELKAENTMTHDDNHNPTDEKEVSRREDHIEEQSHFSEVKPLLSTRYSKVEEEEEPFEGTTMREEEKESGVPHIQSEEDSTVRVAMVSEGRELPCITAKCRDPLTSLQRDENEPFGSVLLRRLYTFPISTSDLLRCLLLSLTPGLRSVENFVYQWQRDAVRLIEKQVKEMNQSEETRFYDQRRCHLSKVSSSLKRKRRSTSAPPAGFLLKNKDAPLSLARVVVCRENLFPPQLSISPLYKGLGVKGVAVFSRNRKLSRIAVQLISKYCDDDMEWSTGKERDKEETAARRTDYIRSQFRHNSNRDTNGGHALPSSAASVEIKEKWKNRSRMSRKTQSVIHGIVARLAKKLQEGIQGTFQEETQRSSFQPLLDDDDFAFLRGHRSAKEKTKLKKGPSSDVEDTKEGEIEEEVGLPLLGPPCCCRIPLFGHTLNDDDGLLYLLPLSDSLLSEPHKLLFGLLSPIQPEVMSQPGMIDIINVALLIVMREAMLFGGGDAVLRLLSRVAELIACLYGDPHKEEGGSMYLPAGTGHDIRSKGSSSSDTADDERKGRECDHIRRFRLLNDALRSTNPPRYACTCPVPHAFSHEQTPVASSFCENIKKATKGDDAFEVSPCSSFSSPSPMLSSLEVNPQCPSRLLFGACHPSREVLEYHEKHGNCFFKNFFRLLCHWIGEIAFSPRNVGLTFLSSEVAFLDYKLVALYLLRVLPQYFSSSRRIETL